jgi:outer membrane protein assembly factor BamA
MPFFPSLQTSILSGFVRLEESSLAIFADGGVVWNVETPASVDTDKRLGAGIELKNRLGLGPFTFTHSLGIAQPHDKLFSRHTYDLYYRVKASVPF